MSLKNYQQAVQIINTDKDRSDFVGPRTDKLILRAEEVTGFKFTGMYRDFLKNYGAGSFGSEEIYGIIDDNFENSSIPNAIWVTITERRKINLPANLLIIYNTTAGEYYCLDFGKLNNDKEPKVVSFYPGFDLELQKYEIIADDFGDFLLDTINIELSGEE